MILPPLRYLRPRSVADAVGLLSSTEGAAVLAGGQTLLNVLKLDLAAPSALVDVHHLDELQEITPRPDGSVAIGAAVTYARLAADPFVTEHWPDVADMAAGLADRQVRNRGTIGGNCCLNDPTSNFPPLMMAMDARFRIQGSDGERVLAAGDFFTGTLSTAVKPGEVLTAVELQPLPAGSRIEHRHLQLGADSWAVARVVVRLDVSDGVVRDTRVVAGAVLDAPHRLATVEAALTGHPADAALADRAASAFDEADVQTVGDVHCSAEYRQRMCKVQLRRAVAAAVEGSAP